MGDKPMFSKIKLSTADKFSILFYNALRIRRIFQNIFEKVSRNGKSLIGIELIKRDEQCLWDNKKSDGCHRFLW